MSTAFLQIAAMLATKAAAATAVADEIRVNPTRPLAQDASLVLDIRQGSASEQGTYGDCAALWSTSYELDFKARVASSGNPASAVDASLAAMFARIKALGTSDLDPLGIRDLVLEPQIDWSFDAADTAFAQAVLRITVEHFVQASSLEPSAIT